MSLTVNQLSKRYKDKLALDAVSLDLQPGVIYGLLGRNGAGKSTLLNIINNRAFPSSGSVQLDGRTVTENAQALSQLYLMSEDNMFPSVLNVRGIFKTTANFHGQFDWELANRLTAAFELNPKTRFSKLSTGYRTIAKYITALASPCEYLFLDEPTLGLDANHRALFNQTLLEAYAARPRTIVISTHLIEEVAGLIEQVIVLDQGRVRTQASTEELAAKAYAISGPAEAVTAFIGRSGSSRDNTGSGLSVLGQESLAGRLTAYVETTTPTSLPALQASLPNGLSVNPLNLQDYFVRLTNR